MFTSQATGLGKFRASPSAVVETASLRFVDDPDGGVSAFDAKTDERVGRWPPETGGFVRVAMRAHARSRRALGIAPVEPFLLERGAEGRLTLIDPQTDVRIGLEAFGDGNADEFAKLLPSQRGTQ